MFNLLHKTVSTVRDLWTAVSYGWYMTKNHRLKPWNSPALRLRMEIVYGLDPRSLTAKQFFGTLWKDRRQVWELAKWVRRMEMLRQ